MNRRLLNAVALGAAMVAAASAYIFAVRPRHLRWGAAEEETKAPLPGDDVLPEAQISVTHAITINAPPGIVWKFLTQIGQGRGGFFSYDWIENLFGLHVQTKTQIDSALQNLKVGDFVRSAPTSWLGGKYKDLTGWFVVELVPDSALVLRDEVEHGSWSFVLKPIDDKTTRLLIRARGPHPATLLKKFVHYGFLEPAHFVMERKMLLTLKECAENVPHRNESVFREPKSRRIVF
jgi:hypothetical protein